MDAFFILGGVDLTECFASVHVAQRRHHSLWPQGPAYIFISFFFLSRTRYDGWYEISVDKRKLHPQYTRLFYSL